MWSWLLLVAALGVGLDLSSLEDKLDEIIAAGRRNHGDVAVSLIHVESGATLSIRGDRRFPMASVYKLPIAVELLAQVAEGTLTLDRPVFLGASDIRVCCTLSRRHPNGGVTLTVGELLELMIVESDNTAGDAVLKLVGGPAAVERRLRARGFETINVNRYEGDIALERGGVANPPPQSEWTHDLLRRLLWAVPPEALSAAHERFTRDPRDTATPDDIARFLGRLQVGDLLSPFHTNLLLSLMTHARTGQLRLRNLLPPETELAHKTGTTDVVIHDVGIITLPAGGKITGHVALAVFVMNGRRVTSMQSVIAQIGGASYEFFTGRPLPPPEKSPPHPDTGIRGASRSRGPARRPRRTRTARHRAGGAP